MKLFGRIFVVGTLYIVPTPVGNIKDITLRALEVLKEVDLILAEDTRRTAKLLLQYEIHKPMESFHEYNEDRKIFDILNKLNANYSIALVSDSGTPTISDPGFKLVRTLIKAGVKIESLPGSSSVTTALAGSGLPTDQFIFLGYLPKKASKFNFLIEFITKIYQTKPTTVIFFESPKRVNKSLKILADNFPDSHFVVARELTKIHEEWIRGDAKKISKVPIKEKGEITILMR